MYIHYSWHTYYVIIIIIRAITNITIVINNALRPFRICFEPICRSDQQLFGIRSRQQRLFVNFVVLFIQKLGFEQRLCRLLFNSDSSRESSFVEFTFVSFFIFGNMLCSNGKIYHDAACCWKRRDTLSKLTSAILLSQFLRHVVARQAPLIRN